jgi:hypothetical protein
MNEQLDIDSWVLAEEIARYLAVVDAFRAANCEPTWRPELRSCIESRPPDQLRRPVEKSTH